MPIRLVLESAGNFTTLDEWVTWVEQQLGLQAAALAEFGELIKRFESQSAQLRAELTAAQAELRETRAIAARPAPYAPDMVHRIDDIDQRLNKVLALFNERYGGGQTEAEMLHHEHAADFVSLIEQGVPGLIREYFQAATGGSVRDKAEFAAHVCAALFASPEVQEQLLVDGLRKEGAEGAASRARQLCEQARALRAKAATGRQQRWEFHCTEGAPLDPGWQVPWTGSDEDGVVALVVAPAYIVDENNVLERQRVFTVARPEQA